MHEFTGERVVPGLVDADLFNEHLSRYRFAASFVASHTRVLDAGCGTGYGTSELATAHSVAAVDISPEAIEYASQNYARPNVFFAAASCAALPFGNATFDLVVAFEVIEHLPDYRALLSEARRVLRPGGVLLVSTPNRAYYTESRAQAGPNPFHVREFDHREFATALEPFFPQFEIWTQNHTDAIVFAPPASADSQIESHTRPDPATAHFFIAVCSDAPLAEKPLFAWIPSIANTLHERELHIAKLESEIAKKDAWLADALARHEHLERSHEQLQIELRERNEWAAQLNREIASRDACIADLQQEAAARLSWIRDLEEQIARGGREIERLNKELIAHSEWGQSLDAELARRNTELQHGRAELEHARAELGRLKQSRWVRLGRKLHVGPALTADSRSTE